MAVGTIPKQVLTDIAQRDTPQGRRAERDAAGRDGAPHPRARRHEGGRDAADAEIEGIGIISDAYFHDIADAIRAQNGRTETYKPAEMAPAILALTWDTGVKIRALLLSDGTLEFNYRDGRSSDVEGATILRAWEVDPAGYPSAGARPWDDDKALVTRAVIDADMEGSGLASAATSSTGAKTSSRSRIRAPHHADQHESDVRELRLAGDDLGGELLRLGRDGEPHVQRLQTPRWREGLRARADGRLEAPALRDRRRADAPGPG